MAPIVSIIKHIVNNSSDSLKKVKMIIMAGSYKNGTQKDWLYFVSKSPEHASKNISKDDFIKPIVEKESTQFTPDNSPKKKAERKVKIEQKESEPWLSQLYFNLDIPKILDDIRQKISNNSPPEPKVLAWKLLTNPQITQNAIDDKTSSFLNLLISSESAGSRLRRLEDFLQHLIAFPGAKQHAVEEGAILVLKFFLKMSNDTSTTHIIRQTLATLGYVDPPQSTGVRILAIDGGGMRGLAVINMLEKLEELSGKSILQLFDYICGVSTGAIITCCLLPPHSMSLKEVRHIYRTLSVEVFNQSALRGTSNLVFSHAYYDTAAWEKLLKSYVGETKLLDSMKHKNCPKVAAISTIINQSKVAPYLFRNYANPYNKKSEYAGGINHTMFEAVRASAAAPTIFKEFRTGDILHQDGGIVVNNPAAVAVHEVRTLWPDEHISCLVSCGTGKLSQNMLHQEKTVEIKQAGSSWKTIFDKILESATDTEAVHNMLNDLLPEDVYFRLNPHLSRKVTMDEVNETKITLLEIDTEMYYRRNKDKFIEIVNKLVEPRTKIQLCRDFLSPKLRLRKY